MGDTFETNTKVLSRDLFLSVVALKPPKQKFIIMRDLGPFLRYCHIYFMNEILGLATMSVVKTRDICTYQ